MTPSVEAERLPYPVSGPISLYAARFARECLLKRVCSDDHPFLDIERRLISEARDMLHAFLLKNMPKLSREEVKKQIRDHAVEKAHTLIEDPSLRKIVIRAIRSAPLDDVFPEVN